MPAAASSSWESPEPQQDQPSTQVSTAQTLRDWEQEEIEAVNRMTLELEMVEQDPISDASSTHDAVEATRERPTKYGRCAKHRCVLYPIISTGAKKARFGEQCTSGVSNSRTATHKAVRAVGLREP